MLDIVLVKMEAIDPWTYIKKRAQAGKHGHEDRIGVPHPGELILCGDDGDDVDAKTDGWKINK